MEGMLEGFRRNCKDNICIEFHSALTKIHHFQKINTLDNIE